MSDAAVESLLRGWECVRDEMRRFDSHDWAPEREVCRRCGRSKLDVFAAPQIPECEDRSRA